MFCLTLSRRHVPLILAVMASVGGSCFAQTQPVEITVKYFSEGSGTDVGGKAETAEREAFYRANPDVRLKAWSGLRLPGNMWMQSDLLAFAGGVAADVQPLFFHQVQFYATQGLLAPLNKLVEDGGLQHDYWQSLPTSFREAGTLDGKVYAIPTGCYTTAFLYRKEVFESVGLDPDKPPATLDEFWLACQKLTDPDWVAPNGKKVGRYALSTDGLVVNDAFMPFFFANGASFVECDWLDLEGRVVLTTKLGKEPPTSVSLSGLKPRFRASFDSPETREALRWIHKFRWSPWVRDPKTGGIRDLTEEEAAVTPGVIRGVTRPVLTQDDKDQMTFLRRGQLALVAITMSPKNGALTDSSLGICPFPPLHAGDPSPTPLLSFMMGLNSGLAAHPDRLAAAEKWLVFATGPEAGKIENTIFADNGLAPIISVWDMRHSGMDDLLSSLPPEWLSAEDYLFSGQNVIPYINGWTAIDQELQAGVIEPIMNSPTFDYPSALTAVAQTANEKVMGLIPPQVQKSRSNWALLTMILTSLAIVAGSITVFKSQLKQARAAAPRASLTPGTKQSRILIYSILLLGPGLLLLALFGYYPVARGLVMAFQDYSLSGHSTFVGLKNFTEGLFASRFWIASLNTLVFVAINLGLGFFAPFLLAILVSELPVGTATFRTIYYLPAITAGLVVTLLWMRLYEPTEFGLLNQIVEPLFYAWNSITPLSWHADWPVKWLQDPKWAMLAVIVPSIWASAGPGSLIYLAALKGIPEEMYEAADLDGCTSWQKMTNITFPAIFPLLLINFIGAFVATFHSMGNIFVMTGGGPNYATHVLALEIWQNAFLYLRFGVATAQAWILAATLIGAVVLQLRILERMDWRRASS